MSRAPTLPGATAVVEADSALVLAPHYDDEVLGCVGLLGRLVEGGAAVRVLFLTDSSGGVEAPGEPEARRLYAERRRREAEEVAALLGLAGTEHLALPDGELHRHLEPAAAALRRALVSFRPGLLLIPSPLEVTSDHRATFRVLHDVLAPLRGTGELAAAVAGLDILVYEVNRPAYPDLLVDVSDRLPLLEAAMARYASQQERHDYLAAGLGLRRFRTLSLGAEVEAAEGYRRLAVDDFTTRSPAQLVRHLGGAPEVLEVRQGPRVSVVVRTRDRPELLAEALESLAAGSYRRAEVVLVNDGGRPPQPPADFPLPLSRVDLAENRGRAAAAEAGVAAATGEYVAFLDDDDLAAPEHLATLAGAVAAAGVRVVYSDATVAVYELDPDEGWACRERRLPYSRDFDADLLLLDNYIPTNTLLIDRRLFDEVGPFDTDLPFFEDWDYLIRLAAVTPFQHLARVTCEYRHFRGGGHHVLGERPRERSDFLAMKGRILAKHAHRLEPEVLARAVDTLRRELVDSREEARTLRRAEEDLRREHTALEDRFHRLNGELQATAEDHRRLAGEVERLYGEERKLRAVVEDQTAHLGRTYAEIERLGGVVREMEATRAWRLHQWWQRKLR